MENIKKAFVTNATANSISFYAMAFLNNQGYTLSQIHQMREKFNLKNLHQKHFTIEELKGCFLNQSAYFLNLYSYMNENDRFEKFTENIHQQNLYKSVFKNYKNALNLNRSYNRQIFHDTLECRYIRLPYDEEKYFANTGIFAEKIEDAQPDFYIVEISWLEKLGMKACSMCGNSDISNRVSIDQLF